MDLIISPDEIDTVHRMVVKKKKENVIRPVLIRFVRRCCRDAVFGAKRHLKNYKINGRAVYLFEHLTPHNSKLLLYM